MIQLQDMHFTYPKAAAPLFDRLSMTLQPGTICGMLGPNGAGKSTLLKIIAGLLFPNSGECRVHEHDPSRRHPDFLADLFLLPEEIYVPALDASTYEARFSPLYPRYDSLKFRSLMTDFSLPLNQALNTFSQGQKKKFLLAFGIATNTRLLIMDEPSNGLDIPSKSLFRRVLVSHYSEDRSFIISTHQVHDLEGLIDSVMIINDGKILLNQSLESIGSRIAVGREMTRPDDALYFEESLDGYEVIRANESGIESRVDLGLLFGFVTGDSARAQSLITGESADG